MNISFREELAFLRAEVIRKNREFADAVRNGATNDELHQVHSELRLLRAEIDELRTFAAGLAAA